MSGQLQQGTPQIRLTVRGAVVVMLVSVSGSATC